MENLFRTFLRQYVKDMIDCLPGYYDIKEADIERVVDSIESDDYIWETIDSLIYDELEIFRKDDEEGDE